MKTPQSKLAIDGGPPAVPQGPPQWPIADESVRAAIVAAYHDGNWGRYHGSYCQQLAKALAEMHQVDHVTLCCSGTIAVELALRGLGVRAGDEVILAGYDFPGNFRAIEAIGAVPVLVDIDPDNWCLDPTRLPTAPSSRTKALVVSHLHGGIAPMNELVSWGHAHGLQVVEDACQASGASVDGRVAGSWGDVGVLSFGGSKLITAGRGGALLTRDALVHQRTKVFCERGNNAFPLSELQAAVVIPQLEKLPQRNAQRADSVCRLLKRTEHLTELESLVNRVPGEPAFYKLAWRYHPKCDDAPQRDTFLAALQAEGAAIDAGFRGFNLRSKRRCRTHGALVHATEAAAETILLHHPVLLEPADTIERLAHALEKVVRWTR